jgi:hypothetical protein
MTGHSDKSLLEKLGLKTGMTACFLHAPENYFELLGTLPPHVFIEDQLNQEMDFIHGFYAWREDLEKDVSEILNKLYHGGCVWVSWPKQASKVPTDITESTLRSVLLPTGLVDVKVCAISDVWSGLKFVWRKETH